MNIFTAGHKKLLVDLLNSNVEFILIGGFAVNYHGYPRYTGDMDIWLKPDDENKFKFISFLELRGFNNNSIDHIKELDFRAAQTFHIGANENRIDFLTKISGVEFNEAYANCVYISLIDKKIPVIRYRHLIINKMMSSRAKDKADVDELQKINRFKKNKS